MDNLRLGQMPEFNPLKGFNSAFENDTKQLGSHNLLEGKIQIQLPEDINTLQDPELIQDLKTLTSNNRQGSENVDSRNLSSAESVSKAFSNALSDGINSVNSAQHASDQAVETFATGGNIDVHSVMIAEQKANLSMQLAMQMRNKLVQAYQEISRIQV